MRNGLRILRRRHLVRVLTVLRFLPDRSNAPSVPPPWNDFDHEVPWELLDVAGERRDRAEEERAGPQYEFFTVHHEAQEYVVDHGKGYVLPVLPRLANSIHRLRRSARLRPAAGRPPQTLAPAELTAALRAEASRIGVSALGIADNDPLYTFVDADAAQLPKVVVCLLEQDWAMTQTAPSDEAEMAAFQGYIEGMDRTAQLTEWLKSRGWRAVPQGFPGDGIAIHYAVAAGLGQLGLNGQLLTPQAGSRCRILLLTTDAPLVCDEPVDFGLHGVCDECKACVRNCPVGAIPQTRKPYRGVTKAKLNTSRCLPVVVQASGCAVCMKVCPVQRYGLTAILEHRERTGEVLGLGTDELEGYDWPLDGKHYGPGATPRVGPEVMKHPDLVFDMKRDAPAPGLKPITFVGDLTSET